MEKSNCTFESEEMVPFMARARCTLCGEELVCYHAETYSNLAYPVEKRETNAFHRCKNNHEVVLDQKYPHIYYKKRDLHNKLVEMEKK